MCDLLLGPPLLHCILGGKLGAEGMCIGGLGIVIGRWTMGSIYTDISILGWGYGAIRESTHVGLVLFVDGFALVPDSTFGLVSPCSRPSSYPPQYPSQELALARLHLHHHRRPRRV